MHILSICVDVITDAILGIESMTVDEKLDIASEMQREDIRLLEEANSLAAEAKDVGAKTIDNLITQNEQIDSAADSVSKINSDLDVASRELRVFMRGVMKDKVIRGVLALAVVVGLVAVIFLIVKPHAKKIVESYKKKKE